MKYFLAVFVITAMFFGCSSSSDQPETVNNVVDKDLELAQFLTEDVVAPRFASLTMGAQEFAGRVQSVCFDKEVEQVSELQNLWTQMMLDFHYTEVFLYGPLLVDDEAKVGDTNEIKKLFYSLQDYQNQATLINKEIEKAAKRKEKYKARSKTNITGLDSLEYVLYRGNFTEGELTSETPSCFYINFVAQDLTKRLDAFYGKFNDQVVAPLATTAGQTEVRVLWDRYSKGMIAFADKELKDRRMAVPLGIKVSSTETFPCDLGVDCHSLYLEHPWSLMARESIETSMTAMSDAFSGGANGGFGFQKFLVTGKDTLPKTSMPGMATELSQSLKKFPAGQSYVLEFKNYLGDEDPSNLAYQYFMRIRTFTTWLKTSFVVQMDAELPGNVQGDND